MGGAVSAGVDNDDLIDNLIKAEYIRTSLIEKVFRCVDRAFYFLPDFKHIAYRDQAWKHENLHLSAPCIYSEVLEQLDLKPGLRFLNIGSGTGYLSTMVGLIIGPYGENDGIEIHADVVEYAYAKLEQFKKSCNGVDVFEFCEPQFIVGNGFDINPDRKYDRIYCGAACPEAYHEHIKRFLKIDGILVVPCEEDLLKIVRNSEDSWEFKSVLPVSFSSLQLPDKKIPNTLLNLNWNPNCLQALCRTNIRSALRTTAENENPDLNKRFKRRPSVPNSKKETYGSHLIIPIYEDVGNDEVNDVTNNRRIGRLNYGQLIFRNNYSAATFHTIIRDLARNDNSNDENDISGDDDDNNNDIDVSRPFRSSNTYTNSSSTDADVASLAASDGVKCENRSSLPYAKGTAAAAITSTAAISSSSVVFDSKTTSFLHSYSDNVRVGCRENRKSTTEKKNYSNASHLPGILSENDCDHDDYSLSKTACKVLKSEKIGDSHKKLTSLEYTKKADLKINKKELIMSKNKARKKHESDVSVVDDADTCLVKQLRVKTSTIKAQKKDEMEQNVRMNEDAIVDANHAHLNDEDDDNDDQDSVNNQPKKLLKREKLDSGISEESDDGKISTENNEYSYSESMFSEPMEIESEDSEFTYDSTSSETRDSDYETTEATEIEASLDNFTVPLRYRAIMEKKIQALPLPQAIKRYLNYDREFRLT